MDNDTIHFLRFHNFAGELASRWNQIFPSLLNTYEKLRKLGFTYSDGKISIIVAENGNFGLIIS